MTPAVLLLLLRRGYIPSSFCCVPSLVECSWRLSVWYLAIPIVVYITEFSTRPGLPRHFIRFFATYTIPRMSSNQSSASPQPSQLDRHDIGRSDAQDDHLGAGAALVPAEPTSGLRPNRSPPVRPSQLGQQGDGSSAVHSTQGDSSSVEDGDFSELRSEKHRCQC